MDPRHFLAAKMWYGVSGGAPTFILPFLSIYYSSTLGFQSSQIGLLAALRPWVSAPFGSAIAGLADRGACHGTVLLLCYVSTTLFQGAMALCTSFRAHCILTVAASVVWAPPQIISDACVMAAAAAPTDYGRVRSLASLAWALMAPLAGFVNGTYGIRAGIAAYVALALAAIPAALHLPLGALVSPPHRAAPEEGGGGSPRDGHGLREPLLPGTEAKLEGGAPFSATVETAAGAAPPTSAVAKALAIIRYIESITEASLIAPTPGLYGFAQVGSEYMAKHMAPSELLAADPPNEVPDAVAISASAGGKIHGGDGAAPGITPVAFGSTLNLRNQQPEPDLPPMSLLRPISVGRVMATLERPAVETQCATGGGQAFGASSSGGRAGALKRHPPHDEAETPRASSVSGSDDTLESLDGAASNEDTLESLPSGSSVRSPFPWTPRGESEATLTPVFDLSRTASVLRPLERGASVSSGQTEGFGRVEAGNEVSQKGGPGPVSTADVAALSGGHGQSVNWSAPMAGGDVLALDRELRSAALARMHRVFASVPATGEATPEGISTRAEGSPDVTPRRGSLSEAPLTPMTRYLEHRKSLLRAGPGVLPANPWTALQTRASARPEATPLSASLEAAESSITPAVMHEAVRVEGGSMPPDAPGTWVITMLESKLRRLARQKRAERRSRRAARQSVAGEGVSPDVERDASGLEQGTLPGTGGGGEGTEGGPVTRQGFSPEDRVDVSLETMRPVPGPPAGLGRLLADPEVVLFFTLVTIMGFGHGLIGAYLFMFVGGIGGSEALMGAVLFANALPELPAFFYFGRLVRHITITSLLFACAGTLAARLLLFTALPRLGAVWVLPVETLHGITFALGWSACTMHSSKIAPPGLESTTQAIFQGLWTGVGTGLGGLLGGFLYASHGPEVMFFAAGAGIAGATLLCALGVALCRRRTTDEWGPAAGDGHGRGA